MNCGPPESPAQGSTEYTSTEYGAKAKYSCNTGYVLSGARSAVCTLDGTWSIPPPTCRSKCDSNYVTKFFSNASLGNLSKHDVTGVDNATAHAKLLFVSASKYVLVCH